MNNAGPDTGFPEYPPGFSRSIVLYPGEGWIGGALEDDVHRFHLRIDHAEGRITSAAGRAVRHPWSACLGAPQHLAAELRGECLADVANRDPREHCTHLFDLAIVAAAHAGDTAETRFDMRVADRIDDRTTATLHRNGEECLRLRLDGSMIEGSERFAGRDLRQVSQWRGEYSPQESEWLLLLRRAVYVSQVRQYEAPRNITAIQAPLARHGACYNYQPPQIETSISMYERREFSTGERVLLEDLEPVRDLAGLA